MHKHHITPRSRGGSDEESNIVLLSAYDHAYHHALDFLEGGPWFDYRHEAWPLLPEELREKIRAEASRRNKGREPPKTFESLSKGGKIGGAIGGKKTYEMGIGIHGLSKEALTARSKKACANTNSQRWRCRVTGHISTPAGLTVHQKHRGIDTSLRDRIS
jgi:hypothetical protein